MLMQIQVNQRLVRLRNLNLKNSLLFLMVVCSFYSCKKRGIERTTIIYKGDTLVLQKFYCKEGYLSSERTFKDSVQHGYVKLFYPNGQLEFYAEYKEGEENGLYESYNSDGKIINRGFYKQGERDSTWIWFYKDGAINNKNNFYKGHNWADQYE
jgi:antitoxin component YwqK of YwqJK toxin-antitoxin module